MPRDARCRSVDTSCSFCTCTWLKLLLPLLMLLLLLLSLMILLRSLMVFFVVHVRTQLDPGLVNSITTDLAKAFRFLHDQGFAHCDICINNTMYVRSVRTSCAMMGLLLFRDGCRQFCLCMCVHVCLSLCLCVCVCWSCLLYTSPSPRDRG